MTAAGGSAPGDETALRRAARARPDDPAPLLRLGEMLATRGRLDEAARALEDALVRAPGHAGGRYNLGVVRAMQGRAEDAVRAFAAVLEADPGHAAAALNLGELHRRRGDYGSALAVLGAAVGRHPDIAPLRGNLGNVLKAVGRLQEAEAEYERAVRLAPDDDAAWGNLLWCSLYDPDRSPGDVAARHEEWGARRAARAAKSGEPPHHGNDPDPDRPLRVGYLSPDLRRHPVAFFMEPLLTHHDRGRVHATCYAHVAHPDAVTARLKTLVPAWRDVRGMDDAALAAAIRADGIDVLVDLAGHTGGSRLSALAFRPAPVQVSYLGYPATTGLAAVGWRVTDGDCDPPGTEAWYTERLVRLESGFCRYLPPADAPPVAPAPCAAGGRVTFGSLINPVKLNRAVAARWTRVLAAVPTARLYLFCANFVSPPARDHATALFRDAGLDPARLTLDWTLAPGESHLSRYAHIDVCLDTLPFCGHTTTCEALWMGVPTVTLAGETFAGRMGVSLAAMTGLSKLVAADEDGFVATAARLAADPGALAEQRAGMRERLRASRLMDGASLAREVEGAYRDMWRAWLEARP